MTEERTVLLVDDVLKKVAPLRMLLEKQGWKVLVASNTATAKNIIQQQKPQVVVTEMVMPVSTGLTLCKECQPYCPHFILLVSLEESVKKLKRQGNLEVFVQPDDWSTVLQAIQKKVS